MNLRGHTLVRLPCSLDWPSRAIAATSQTPSTAASTYPVRLRGVGQGPVAPTAAPSAAAVATSAADRDTQVGNERQR